MLMQDKIKTLCDQVYEDIQSLRESDKYEVEKRLGVEIMALNSLCNAAKTIMLRTTDISKAGHSKTIYSCLAEERE